MSTVQIAPKPLSLLPWTREKLGLTIVGDEGKGKLTDILCREVQLCARAQGGHNAGHSVVANGKEYDFRKLTTICPLDKPPS